MSKLEKAQEQYKELLGKNVPARYKNDIEWIQGKIDAAEAIEPEGIEKPEVDQEPESKPEEGAMTFKDKLRALDRGVGIPCDATGHYIFGAMNARFDFQNEKIYKKV